MKNWGLASSELMKTVFRTNKPINRVLNSYSALVSQSYTGDINILPSSSFINPINALAARSSEEVIEMLTEGERATWPMIERIRIQTFISRTLNRLVDELDESIVTPKTVSKKKRVKKAVNK